LFVAGFSAVFILLGSLLGLVGETIPAIRLWLSRLGGAVIILFGLWTVGLLSLPFPAGKRIAGLRKYGYGGSALMGVSFGAGWTPCVGPTLSVILGLSLSMASAREGAFLLSVYSLGLAVPFLITGAFTSRASGWVLEYQKKREQARTLFTILRVLGGTLLIILGIFVFTNNLERFLSLFAAF
jgi:cytochrome c-type biogenesis protein